MKRPVRIRRLWWAALLSGLLGTAAGLACALSLSGPVGYVAVVLVVMRSWALLRVHRLTAVFGVGYRSPFSGSHHTIVMDMGALIWEAWVRPRQTLGAALEQQLIRGVKRLCELHLTGRIRRPLPIRVSTILLTRLQVDNLRAAGIQITPGIPSTVERVSFFVVTWLVFLRSSLIKGRYTTAIRRMTRAAMRRFVDLSWTPEQAPALLAALQGLDAVQRARVAPVELAELR